MRFARVSVVSLLAVFLLLLSYATVAGAQPSAAPRTYTVLVGAESAQRGVGIMAFFPHHVTVHVGDTVHWIQNSNEIHTVTFLGGAPLPDFIVPAATLGPSPLVFNPLVTGRTAQPGSLGDATTWANSGIMGREAGQYRSFTLTFTAAGTYPYICVVHGMMMSGTVTVVGPGTPVASPGRQLALGHAQIAAQFARVPAVLREARQQIQPATENVDGTLTHHILIGYHKGQIDLMRFFPKRAQVRPGDKVEWIMSPSNEAPHTVTFLNGQEEPGLVIPVPQPSGPPLLYVDPATLFPSQPAPELTRTGIYNSGLMLPIPGTTWSQVIGDVTPGPLHYLCLLHDLSGMKGSLVVLPE